MDQFLLMQPWRLKIDEDWVPTASETQAECNEIINIVEMLDTEANAGPMHGPV